MAASSDRALYVGTTEGLYRGEPDGVRYEADFDHFDEYVGMMDEGGAAGVERAAQDFQQFRTNHEASLLRLFDRHGRRNMSYWYIRCNGI